MDRFATLTNAAREFIEARVQDIETNGFGLYGTEDVESVHREREAIEAEIARLEQLVSTARAVARMRHPSVETLLRRRGFGYEADQVAALVCAINGLCCVDARNCCPIQRITGTAIELPSAL